MAKSQETPKPAVAPAAPVVSGATRKLTLATSKAIPARLNGTEVTVPTIAADATWEQAVARVRELATSDVAATMFLRSSVEKFTMARVVGHVKGKDIPKGTTKADAKLLPARSVSITPEQVAAFGAALTITERGTSKLKSIEAQRDAAERRTAEAKAAGVEAIISLLRTMPAEMQKSSVAMLVATNQLPAGFVLAPVA